MSDIVHAPASEAGAPTVELALRGFDH